MAINAASGLRPDDLGHRAALDAGHALLDAGDAAGAVPFLRRANAARPTPIGFVRLGAAYRDLGIRALAIDAYESALALEGTAVATSTPVSDLRPYSPMSATPRTRWLRLRTY